MCKENRRPPPWQLGPCGLEQHGVQQVAEGDRQVIAPMLTAQASFFQAAGYLRNPGLIEVGQVERLTAAAYGMASHDTREEVSRSPDTVRIDQVTMLHSTYLEVASSDRVLNALEPLLGPNIELVENRHNHVSMYRTQTIDRLHRDVLQWSRTIVTVLIYLSDCSDFNSATRVVPGSHQWPCIGRPNNGGTWMEEVAPYADLCDQAVSIPSQAGDALLMHGQLYHAGAGASANGPRIVLALAYRSVDELTADAPPGSRLVRGERIYRGRGVAARV